MSESGSRTSRNNVPKGVGRPESECARSDTRLSETANTGSIVPRPPATSTDSQLTRSDAPDGSQQPPISAEFVSLIATLYPSVSSTGSQPAPEELKRTPADRERLRKQRLRSAANRATRKASAGEASSPAPVDTVAMSDWEESRAKWAKNKAEFDERNREWDAMMGRFVFDGDGSTQGPEGPDEGSAGR